MSSNIKEKKDVRCEQCQLTIDLARAEHVKIYDKDTNEDGYLHHSCKRFYAHHRNFRVLEEHVSH